jgi:hypothetical protein
MSRKSDLLILSEQYAKVYEGMKVVEAPASEGDASTANMGPGGVLEVQPDGQYPEPPAKDENAENSQEENEAAFMQRFEQAKEEGKKFFESLDGITDMTWDKSLPEGALEQLVDYMETGLSFQMASDIKAHLLRALQDVASSTDSL